MKKIILVLFVVIATLHAQSFEFQYVSPKPNSIMVTNETNIILRHSDDINSATISDNLIKVEGAKSGVHYGDLILSDDDKTIVFNPYNSFADEEIVRVQLKRGIKTLSGFEINEYSFSFTIAPNGIVQRYDAGFSEEISLANNQFPTALKGNGINSFLPAPHIIIDSVNNPSPGYIFMATWDRNVPQLYGNFIFLLDHSGNIVDSVRVNGAPYDFQVQSNGLLSYALGDFASNVPLPGEELQHIVLDSTLAVVDSFKMRNGYVTDFHEFLILPNGHVMMMSYHTIIFDMSTIVTGGQTNCSLVINIIQEQDRDKNVVFEWRNIDYIPITDSDLDLTLPRINYGTLNAFDIDDDGNILASFRDHSEIMKISRATGEVIWRMGGPRGEFKFIGEHEENAPYYFARQHNIHRLPNGNITLFDNGQFHQPPYSRAVEYTLDEVSKVATLVSEWRYTNGNIFTATAGNAEKLSSGGWFIGYGVPHPQYVKRNAVEVHPDESIALELSLPNGVLAYRVYKSPWKKLVSKPSFTHIEVIQGGTYSFNDASNITGVEITFTALSAAGYNEATITRLPYGPVEPEFFGDLPNVFPVSIRYTGFAIASHTSEIHFDLSTFPEIKNSSTTSIYWREFPNSGLFLQRPTTYDSLNNELIAAVSGFGEIIFGDTGYQLSANTPIPYEPLNSIKILPLDSIAIRWTGSGYFDSFNVQISTDSTFSTILIDSTLNSSFIVLKNAVNFTKYFWRVKSNFGSDESAWSPIWSFDTTDPFINMISPNGGEQWSLNSTEIIRWETNISDSVSIRLLADQQNYLAIGNSLGNVKAFAWEISSNLSASSEYTIQIMSILDSNLIASSEQSFSIIDSTTIVENNVDVMKDYMLHQNYPNPFNPSTNITFETPLRSHVNVTVYNLLGESIATLANGVYPPGIFQVKFDGAKLSSGIYLIRMQADNYVQTIKSILIK